MKSLRSLILPYALGALGTFLGGLPGLSAAVPALPLASLRPPEGSDFRAMRAVEEAAVDPTLMNESLDLGAVSFADQQADHRAEGEETAAPVPAPAPAVAPTPPPAPPVDAEASMEDFRRRHPAVTERQAELALRVGDYQTAAEVYARIIDQSLDDERRKKALLSLAEVYRAMDDPMRVVSILERFKREFPEERRLPEVLLRLGFLYREIGVSQRAVDAFFGVLRQSFNLNTDDLRAYREITNEASYQIAETYYRMHQYELAAEFFTRLLRAARPDTPERLELLAKCAYANYFSGDYRRVLYLLELKNWGEIDANRQAEFRFLRASAFWALQDRDGARSEVVNLADLEVEPNQDPYWNFWWKFVGNELANDLYAQEDFAMAHKLYYSLLHLSEEQKWQLPIIFQIGRCREQLGAHDEAQAIYQRILEQIGAIEMADRAGNLIVLQTRVEDQLKNLEWEQELSHARDQYAPPDREPHDRTQSLASLNARSG